MCTAGGSIYGLSGVWQHFGVLYHVFDSIERYWLHDLHTHSRCSDGILRPQALVSRAKEKGVSVLALTDHDTTVGLAEAREAATQEGIELINGIELSCLWNGIGIHIVGLNFDLQQPSIQDAQRHQTQSRDERAEKIAERLAKLGMPGALEGARALSDGGVIGRPHFAQYLINKGHVSSMNAAFKRYLGAGKPGDVKQLWPDVAQAVEWIVGAGGVAVVAHPDKYKMTRTKLKRLLDEFIEVGGQAMEVVSGGQSPNVTRDMSLIARQKELYASCGSDFHVPDQPWQELGSHAPLPADLAAVWELWETPYS